MSLFRRRKKDVPAIEIPPEKLQIIRTNIRRVQWAAADIKATVLEIEGLWEQVKTEFMRVLPYVLKSDLEGLIEAAEQTSTFKTIVGDGQWLK